MDLKNLNAYEIVEEREIPDIGARGIYLRHKKTGARVILLPSEDNNKVFNIVFRTPPRDSTGVPHIIEHTVLCGSSKYPVKDPFIELAKGSFKTFLNAMTFPDKTMYPVASTNDKDFFNLMDVYLDAVFHPYIYKEKNIFMQEGWSYRMENENAPLEYSGVVYSEMKGVYSSPDDILEHEIMTALFPDTTYGVESGGDPKHIPELTYEQYLKFHSTLYHPSNSYIIIYGNADMEMLLQYIDREYLSSYERKDVDSTIISQRTFDAMKEHIASYPVDAKEDEKGKTYLTYNVVTGNCFDIKELIAFEVIDYALVSAPGAPLRERLLKSGIGNDVFGNFSDGILQPYFSIISKNADLEQKEEFLDIIKDELTKQVEKGIDKDSVLARLNYLEFQFREGDFGTYPKGIFYSMNLMETFLYDDTKPFDELMLLSVFAALKDEVKNNTGYFESLVKKYLIEGKHAALVVLKPEKGLAEANDAKLKAKLADIKAKMTPEEIKKIVVDTKMLQEYQEREDDPADIEKLPGLDISDIKKEAVLLSNVEDKVESKSGDTKIIYHDVKSNGISYTELYFKLDDIREEECVYLSLLKTVLQSVDTKRHTYLELSNDVNMNTGGISYGISTFDHKEDSYSAYFGIKVKNFIEKTPHAFGLINEVLTESIFDDTDRLKDILSELWSGMRISLSQAGHVTAVNRAAAYFSSEAAFVDKINGVAFFKALDGIMKNYDSCKNEVVANLKKICARIFNTGKLIISQTGDKEGLLEAKKHLPELIDSVYERFSSSGSAGDEGIHTGVMLKPYGMLQEGLTTAGQVQYVGMADDYSRKGFNYNGSLQVLRHIMNYGYLWDKIRVHGNAYGCGCSFKRNGLASFMSYRDPHIKSTIEAIKALPEYLRKFDISKKDMEKQIIGTISETDIPMPPALFGAVSFRAYMNGITQEELQRERDEIIGTDAKKIAQLADFIEAVTRDCACCVVGSGVNIDSHKELFDNVEPLL